MKKILILIFTLTSLNLNAFKKRDIFDDVLDGKIEKVKEYLNKKSFFKPNPNKKNKLGVPLLALAIKSDNLETVKLLLEHKANPNVTPLGNVNLLSIAIFKQRKYEIIELLLNHKADPNTKPVNPLFFAIDSDNLAVLDLLLKNNADPNQYNGQASFDNKIFIPRAYPIISATNHLEVLKKLISHPKTDLTLASKEFVLKKRNDILGNNFLHQLARDQRINDSNLAEILDCLKNRLNAFELAKFINLENHTNRTAIEIIEREIVMAMALEPELKPMLEKKLEVLTNFLLELVKREVYNSVKVFPQVIANLVADYATGERDKPDNYLDDDEEDLIKF